MGAKGGKTFFDVPSLMVLDWAKRKTGQPIATNLLRSAGSTTFPYLSLGKGEASSSSLDKGSHKTPVAPRSFTNRGQPAPFFLPPQRTQNRRKIKIGPDDSGLDSAEFLPPGRKIQTLSAHAGLRGHPFRESGVGAKRGQQKSPLSGAGELGGVQAASNKSWSCSTACWVGP